MKMVQVTSCLLLQVILWQPLRRKGSLLVLRRGWEAVSRLLYTDCPLIVPVLSGYSIRYRKSKPHILNPYGKKLDRPNVQQTKMTYFIIMSLSRSTSFLEATQWLDQAGQNLNSGRKINDSGNFIWCFYLGWLNFGRLEALGKPRNITFFVVWWTDIG